LILEPSSRNEWLEKRTNGIGGSDAGAAVGLNKYKSNVDLWKEKTGAVKPTDISGKPAVAYGKAAEYHLRELFKLDFPEYSVEYSEFRMYFREENPFMFATLDGELTDSDGQRGILEIKTATIQNSAQWDEWNEKIPDSYYAQILHQLACTGWDFAILKAHLRYLKGDDLRATTRHYKIERKDVESDIDFLVKKECEFWKCVESNIVPNLILPEI
jgi:putative phage-type endonuclease